MTLELSSLTKKCVLLGRYAKLFFLTTLNFEDENFLRATTTFFSFKVRCLLRSSSIGISTTSSIFVDVKREKKQKFVGKNF